VDRIVVVTGFNATHLERHLAGNDIVFLRNEAYETTQMFDSVKIGLQYMKDKCDAILLTPVDIPLFTSASVTALMDSGAKLACPTYHGQQGHPLMISCDLVDRILADPGEGGLRGALSRCGEPMRMVPVPDEGILFDADTPEDFSRLLEYHNAQLVRPTVDVSLSKEKVFLDSRVATLLMLVEETHSVREACQKMQISYSKGWDLIRTLESQFKYPLILRSQGGSGGSRSTLSELCKVLLERYQAYREAVCHQAEQLYETYFGDLL